MITTSELHTFSRLLEKKVILFSLCGSAACLLFLFCSDIVNLAKSFNFSFTTSSHVSLHFFVLFFVLTFS